MSPRTQLACFPPRQTRPLCQGVRRRQLRLPSRNRNRGRKRPTAVRKTGDRSTGLGPEIAVTSLLAVAVSDRATAEGFALNLKRWRPLALVHHAPPAPWGVESTLLELEGVPGKDIQRRANDHPAIPADVGNSHCLSGRMITPKGAPSEAPLGAGDRRAGPPTPCEGFSDDQPKPKRARSRSTSEPATKGGGLRRMQGRNIQPGRVVPSVTWETVQAATANSAMPDGRQRQNDHACFPRLAHEDEAGRREDGGGDRSARPRGPASPPRARA